MPGIEVSTKSTAERVWSNRCGLPLADPLTGGTGISRDIDASNVAAGAEIFSSRTPLSPNALTRG